MPKVFDIQVLDAERQLQVSSGLRNHGPGAGALGWSLGFMIGFRVYAIGDSTGCLAFGAWVLGSEVVLAFKIESNLSGWKLCVDVLGVWKGLGCSVRD